MKEIYNIVKDKELVVRKRVIAIIEKVLRALDLDFNHDRYKQIVYEQSDYNTDLEIRIKHYYDAFTFLLNNKKTAVMASFLSTFHYVITNEELDKEKGIRLASKYFYISDEDPLNKAIIFHIEFYKELNYLKEYERTLMSIMIFEYILVKNNIPLVHMVKKDVLRYIKYKDMYIEGNKRYLYEFLRDLIIKNKYQEKSFYKNLKELSLYDIEKTILEEKDRLINEYKVESIMVFGSFYKGDYRIDSDIDLLVIMNEEMSYKEKLDKLNRLSEYLQKKFNRYVDLHEVFKELTDDFLKETNKIKIIY